MARAQPILPANTTGAALSSVASIDGIYGHGGGAGKKVCLGGCIIGGRDYIQVTTKKGQAMKQKDFRELKRYPNGDIVDLYPIHHLLTDRQKNRLTCDDFSRVEEYQAEIEFELHCLLEELQTA